MSATEHIDVRRTFRGHAARVGGVVAGIALALAVQPAAAAAHDKALHHAELYVDYWHDAGKGAWGDDANGDKPNDQSIIDKAHAEQDTSRRWHNGTLAIEGGAAMLLGAGVAFGMGIARREETAAAVWSAATHAAPSI